MADRVVELLEAAAQAARGRATAAEFALSQVRRQPYMAVEELQRVLRPLGLAIVESDALRVALDQFDIADTVEMAEDGHADFADVDKARKAIDEAWKASK